MSPNEVMRFARSRGVARSPLTDAENAAKMARSNPTPPGVTITGVEVREVIAEAKPPRTSAATARSQRGSDPASHGSHSVDDFA